MSGLIIAIIGTVVLVLLIVMAILSRISVAGPNEAFIVTGRKGRSVQGRGRQIGHRPVRAEGGHGRGRVRAAGGAAAVPARPVQPGDPGRRSPRAVSKQGIRCDADAVAIVKVGGTAEMIRPAAQRFLHQQDRIEAFTAQVLAGALRAVIGRLTVEEIIRDRAAFAAHVAEEAERSLTHQGLVLDAFQLEDIRTAGTYLQDLGRPEAARVLKAAAIAEAQARQNAETGTDAGRGGHRRGRAEPGAEEGRRYRPRSTPPGPARPSAGPLAQAERQQAILTEQQKVAERNAELKQRQLDTEVRKPADAARYRVEQEAEAARNAAVFRADAERQATIAAAQAQAEQARLIGEGERSRRAALAEAAAIEGAKQGEAEKKRRTANADATEREGAGRGVRDPGPRQRRGRRPCRPRRTRSPRTARRPCSICWCGYAAGGGGGAAADERDRQADRHLDRRRLAP